MPSIALFGAAGAIGQSTAAALRQQGRAYRVVGRSEARLRQSFGADPLAEMHYYLLTDPLIMDDAALHALLGPIAKTPYAQGIRATLDAARA